MKYIKCFEQFDMEQVIDSWEGYYGNRETAKYKLDCFLKEFNVKNTKGGKLYRCLFVDSKEEINISNLGKHWTLEDYYIEDYINNIETYYRNGKKMCIVIELYTEPNNIKFGTIHENPNEMEVNVIDFSKTKIVNYYIYENNKLIPIQYSEL